MVCLYLILELVYIFIFTLPVSAQLYLNEILPNPSTAEPATEWLELYNASSSALTLTNYAIQDDNQNTFTLPEATISAHGYLVFYGADGIPSLNNSGDTISLYDPNHQLLDSYSYSFSQEDMSWARVPDGGDFSSQTQTPTPNQPNPTPTSTPTPSPSPTPTPTPTSSPNPSSSPTPTPSPTLTLPPSPSPSPAHSSLFSPPPQPNLKLELPTVLSASTTSSTSPSAELISTSSANSVSSNQKNFPFSLVVGLILLLISLGYFFLFV